MEIKLITLFNIFYAKYSLEVLMQTYMQSPVCITFTFYLNYLKNSVGS